MSDYFSTIALVGTLLLAFSAGYMVAARRSGAEIRPLSIFNDRSDAAVFIFDDNVLLDANSAGRALLAHQPNTNGEWDRFLRWSSQHFSDISHALEELPDIGVFTRHNDSLELRAEHWSGAKRITVSAKDPAETPSDLATLAQRALGEEVVALRMILNRLDVPIWRECSLGSVIWCNDAYAQLIARLPALRDAPPWPIPNLFPKRNETRVALNCGGGQGLAWFECHRAASPDGSVAYALPSDRLVQAETALENFLQTLTKTFADLPIGLAIFDPQKRLKLFNPALLDLVGLTAPFLLGQPSLYDFLDAMRAAGTVPEPKDYKDWRKTITALEASAQAGSYQEIWHLPADRTYRVIARPHTEGAIALIVQDISQETSKLRHLHADLELGQSVLDASDEAIAVFSVTGILLLSNQRYAELWGSGGDDIAAPSALTQELAQWRRQTAPTQFWNELEQASLGAGQTHQPITGLLRLRNGLSLECKAVRLEHGATRIGFQLRAPDGKRNFEATPAAEPPAPRAAEAASPV